MWSDGGKDDGWGLKMREGVMGDERGAHKVTKGAYEGRIGGLGCRGEGWRGLGLPR